MPRIVSVALLIVAASLLFACTSQTFDPSVVTIALDQPPINLDPRIGQDASSERIDTLIFSALVKRNDHFDIEPDVATSWQTPNPTTYIFHLRRDVTFHDGRPLTARDVAFTYRSILDGTVRTSKSGYPLNLISSIEAPDDYTVAIKLKEVFTPLLSNLTIGIVPEGSGPDFNRQLIGSGPFVFDHYTQDQEVVLRRNDSYFGDKARVSMLRFKIVPEAIVQALELRKGSADLSLNVLTPDMVEVLKRNHDLNVMQGEGTNYQYLAFNLADPVFKDLRVRQAFAYAIDREKIIKYLWRSQARAATGLLPPNNWAYEPSVKTYAYDPERARKLLKEAGHDRLSFTYRTSQDDTGRLMAAILQAQLREIGVTMDIRSNEFATFFSDVVQGNFQMYSLRWVGGNNNPDFFNSVFHSRMTPPNGANRGHYSNPRVDELVELSRREPDLEKRKAAYQEIQRIVAEDLPYISLFYMDNVAVYNKRIDGVHLSPAADYVFLTRIQAH
jgi:peptide/nickel transport system substrate-binding protein